MTSILRELSTNPGISYEHLGKMEADDYVYFRQACSELGATGYAALVLTGEHQEDGTIRGVLKNYGVDLHDSPIVFDFEPPNNNSRRVRNLYYETNEQGVFACLEIDLDKLPTQHKEHILHDQLGDSQKTGITVMLEGVGSEILTALQQSLFRSQ